MQMLPQFQLKNSLQQEYLSWSCGKVHQRCQRAVEKDLIKNNNRRGVIPLPLSRWLVSIMRDWWLTGSTPLYKMFSSNKTEDRLRLVIFLLALWLVSCELDVAGRNNN